MANALSQTLAEFSKLYTEAKEDLLKDFFHFLSLQSVSTDPAYKDQVLTCADWVEKYVQVMGFTTERWQTPGYPVIFGSWMNAGPKAPTVLFYQHYDVQPIDPIELWKSPPFEPTVRDGEVFARGAGDNKGQCFYVLAALKRLLQTKKTLPINVKLVIEGEEEVGSNGFAHIVASKKKELSADHMFVFDVSLHEPDQPQVTLGLRGIGTMEVEFQGSNVDLHSGGHGGAVFNPNHALVQTLSKLRDSNGKVTVPGFYDDVLAVTQADRELFDFHLDEKKYTQAFETEITGGEKGFSPLERVGIRPTLELNGISGGYTGEGFKTVIPAKAIAKISCRLVPNQNPDKILASVKQFIEENTPSGIRANVKLHHGNPAIRANPKSTVVKATAQAFSDVLGKPCRFVLQGGSIPIAQALAEVSGAEMVLCGYGLPDDNWHSPNEHFGLDRLEKGFVTVCRVIELLGST